MGQAKQCSPPEGELIDGKERNEVITGVCTRLAR